MRKNITEIERLLAENLRHERKAKGFKSRKDLASKAKVHEVVIMKAETMATFPKPKNLERLAKALDMKAYELLIPKDEKNLLLMLKNVALKNKTAGLKL